MKLNLYSFRSKIIVTLVIVIASISFFSFYIYYNFLSKQINKNAEENIISVLNLLKDQYLYTIRMNDGKILYSILKTMKKNEQVLNTYLIDSEGKIVFPDENKSLSIDSLAPEGLAFITEDITLKRYKTGTNSFLRAFMRMNNSPNCYECHSPSKKNLGFIIFDFSMNETKKNIAFTQMFSLFFTVFMVLFIGGSIILIHYKFVRRWLFHFYSSIKAINQGDLSMRLTIPETNELGQLGKSFNEMLDNFQKNQNELYNCHQKELQNTHNLATIGEMAARLAHEIRNPITGIANAIEIIVDEMKEDQNKPILEEIQRQANRVNDVITDLLKYAQSKDININKGDINEIIKSLVFFLENQAHSKKISFRLKLQIEIPAFNFDHEQIENVLLNLSINAIQAISNKGIITFKTTYNPFKKVVIISVEDTGKGIPKIKRAKIFNPFYTTRTEGTGLGLAIAKDIVKKHNGEIWVENNIGGGSIFSISLPQNV